MVQTFPVIASISGFVAFLLCYYANGVASWLGVMDVPNERKLHKSETPLMGGIVLQMAFVPAAIAFVLLTTSPNWIQSLLILLAAVFAMTLVGLADDRHTLSARDRLLISFLVFGSSAILDPLFRVRVLDFAYLGFSLGLGTGWLAVIFTTICCVGLLNAVNMADGKNGLVIGLCLGWCGLLALRAPAALLPIIALLAVGLVVLLGYNLANRLFLGDGGSYGLATAIGLIAIATYNSLGSYAGRAISADELMLVFAVPVLDAFRLTFARLRRGQSPMAADRDHLHHHLQNRFGWPKGLVAYWALAIFPAVIALAFRT